jgi:ABC-type nitrate/sulfonate/bicarbonate transport system substrate-binding protein
MYTENNMTTILAAKKDFIKLKPQEVLGVVRASEKLLDLVEDILERHSIYQPEFIRGLKTSFKQAKQKNVITVASLKNL